MSTPPDTPEIAQWIKRATDLADDTAIVGEPCFYYVSEQTWQECIARAYAEREVQGLVEDRDIVTSDRNGLMRTNERLRKNNADLKAERDELKAERNQRDGQIKGLRGERDALAERVKVWDGGALGLIAAERERQVTEEGWSPEHDDGHTDGSLQVRAAELAVEGTDAHVEDPSYREPDGWGLVAKHKHDDTRCLVIAGALIVAELERQERDTLAPQAHSGEERG